MRASPKSPLMAPEQIPVVDLRSLSQSDIQTLSLSSSAPLRPLSAASGAGSAAPRIDKSVFNESAGSRKQTYSRLRLAPISSSSKRNPNPNPNSGLGELTSSYKEVDPSGRENQLIVSHLRKLFAKEDPSFTLPAAPLCDDAQQTLILHKKEEEKDKSSDLVTVTEPDRDKEIVNSIGEAIDLGELGQKVDPYIEEIRKRTEGLKSDGELLGFLGGLEGEWMSRRQRRRFVDASGFGNHLPKGWKLLLGLKRKEGIAWVNCRRFVSPNGHHFETCKEVSSYIQSLLGIAIPNNTTPVSTKNETSSFGANTLSPLPVKDNENETKNDNWTQECTKCHLNFTNKGLYLQHQLSFHQKSRKRRRNNNDPNEEIIMKDGKYICQYCDKTFDERSRYFGHVGAHVRYQGGGNPKNLIGNLKSGEKSLDGNPRNVNSSLVENPKKGEKSLDGNPRNVSSSLVENPKKGEKSVVENFTNHNSSLNGNPKIGETLKVESLKDGEKSLKGNPTDESTSLVENHKNGEKSSIENPRIEKIPLIGNYIDGEKSLVENPKNDNTPLIGNPKNVEMPSIENPKNGETSATKAPSSSENPKLGENDSSSLTKNPKDSKTPEIQVPTCIQNPKSDNIKPEIAEEIQVSPLIEVQTLPSVQNPNNGSIPEIPFVKDETIIEGNNNITGSITEVAVCDQIDNNNICELKESEEFYEMNEEYPAMTYPQLVSQIFSPDDLYDENELSNNNNNDQSEELGKCPEMETFDLNNFDIVSTSNNNNNATNICKASSEETSFMDEANELNEINESELPSRPITFSELLANANAHANANLDLNNNIIPDRNDTNTNRNNTTNNTHRTTTTNNNNHNENHQHLMDFGTDLFPRSLINNSSLMVPLDTQLKPNYSLDTQLKPNFSLNTSINQQLKPNYSVDTSINQQLKPNYSIGELKQPDYSACFTASPNGFDMNMEWVKPVETRYENNNPQPVMSGTGRNFMEMMTMQDGLDDSFTSMVQSASSSSIPIPNVLPNKLNIGYHHHHQYVNNAPIPSFGAMHMPHNNNNNNNNIAQQQATLFGIPPQMVNPMVNAMVNPALQLGWGLPMPAQQQHQHTSSVCVWCSREFRHEASSLAQQNQADSLGFICPSCKDRFSGHGHLGL